MTGTTSQTLWFGWFVVALGVVGLGAAGLVARSSAARLVRRVRRPGLDAGAALAGVMAAAVADDDDPDELVMRAAFELVRLLDLRDCRWAVTPGVEPVARLDDDGSVSLGVFRWPTERLGLPQRGVQRPLVAHGASFGALVLVPRGSEPVPVELLRGGVAIADLVALALHDRRTSVVPGTAS